MDKLHMSPAMLYGNFGGSDEFDQVSTSQEFHILR